MKIRDSFARFIGRIASPGGERGRLVVLFYHRVSNRFDPLTPDVLWSRPFEMQMSALARTFNVLPLEDAAERLVSGTLPDRALSITFDDGYLDNVQVALPILLKYGLHATFFLTTGYLNGGLMFNDMVVESVRRMAPGTVDLRSVGLGEVKIDGVESRIRLIRQAIAAVKYLTPTERDRVCAQMATFAQEPLPNNLMMKHDDVADLIEAGMSIGGHTVDHPILARIADEEAYMQIVTNREMLAQLVGQAPRVFAYPNGKPGTDYGPEHVRMVEDAGYSFAFSTASRAADRHNDKYQLPRICPWDDAELPFIVHLFRVAQMRR